VFNSALLDIHAVAILPEEMSRERFEWLRDRGAEVYATPGCESNVKEIYDKCHELEAESDEYLVLNQFDQFGNAVWHFHVTGQTIERLYADIAESGQRLSAFVSATGSAGTIAAGDYLTTIFPHLKVLATEALQCPTLLRTGFGGHRIEGIGDKHVPWIHNARNTDVVAAIDDEDTMRLLRLFNEPAGQELLASRSVPVADVHELPLLGISSIGNLLAAIKTARWFELDENDVLFTSFTDSVGLYRTRLDELRAERGDYDPVAAEVDFERRLLGASTDHMRELTYPDRKAIHNLKYFTWVEQQGRTVEELEALWNPAFWTDMQARIPEWDEAIRRFNEDTGVLNALEDRARTAQ